MQNLGKIYLRQYKDCNKLMRQQFSLLQIQTENEDLKSLAIN